MQSWFSRFFLPTFHENFKFLKNCSYNFYKILHSHSTPKGAPACAIASKSYDWNVRNIAKISPKMVKKQPFFDFLLFSQKRPYDSNEILNRHSTPYYGPLCAISSNSYDWEWSESEGKRPKPTPLPHMRLWFHVQFRFVQSIKSDVSCKVYKPGTAQVGTTLKAQKCTRDVVLVSLH